MRRLLTFCSAVVVAVVVPSLADAQNQSRPAKGPGQSVGAMGKQLFGASQPGRLLQVGQQLPSGFNGFTALNSIPAPARALLPRGFNYVQQACSIAVVDPAS